MTSKQKELELFIDFIKEDKAALKVWELLNKRVGKQLRPCYAAFETQTPKTVLIWNEDDYCASVDVYQDETFEWFVFDRQTKESEGTKNENRVKEPPEELIEFLKTWCMVEKSE